MGVAMKRNKIWRGGRAILLAGTLGLAAVSAKAENLADALASAYNTSGLLEQNRALLRAADEDVGIAVSRLRPVLDYLIRVQRTYNKTGIASAVTSRTNSNPLAAQLSLDWLLFDNGQSRLLQEAAKATVLSTRQQLLGFEQQVLFRAISAYLNVLLQQESVRLQGNNLRVLGEELRAAQDRFDVGEVTRTDVALAQSRVAEARANLVAARGALENARAEYTAVVGHAPQNLSPVPRLPAPPASVSAATAVALRQHPDIIGAQYGVEANEFRVRATSAGLGPKLNAGAQVGLSERLDNSGYGRDVSASLTLSQRIYQGGALNAGVRRAMAQRDASRANLLTVQKNVRQDVDDAFVRLQVAQASLAATSEQIRAARVAFDGIREEATLGARTTLDVLAAEQDLLDAETARIRATSERSIALYQLLAVQGILTAERLGLAVQLYDPTIYYNLAKTAPAGVSKQSKDLDRVLKALGRQ
jgi:outer membrane protein